MDLVAGKLRLLKAADWSCVGVPDSFLVRDELPFLMSSRCPWIALRPCLVSNSRKVRASRIEGIRLD